MRLLIKIGIIFIFFGCSINLSAQTELKIDTTKNIILQKEISGGVIFHNRGWGIRFNKGKNLSAFKRRMFEVEMAEMKSLKQIRSINPWYTNSKSYVYGKLNTIFILRSGFGLQKLLNRKPYWGGVELRYFFNGGASLAITKPIYLYIVTEEEHESSITEEKYDSNKHFSDNIYGRAPFTKGFNEIKIYPGIYAKLGFDFEFGVYNTKIKSLEVGAIIDFFPQAVPIMAFNENENYFLTFFICFSFGKRYN
ncbi:MAG: hypothetical protein K8R58_12390 [Bacteroidales bacterium]|nr:hypothetical protein [Bacteroidales bacterium]